MKNTKFTADILKYIPFLYVIWSDELISPSEIAVFEKAVKNDSLSNEDKKTLKKWSNPDKSPSDETLKSWKALIDDSGVKLIESDPYPLTYFSMRLKSKETSIVEPDENLMYIEKNLGIQPNHYHHLFNVKIETASEANFYSAETIDTVLKGNRATHIDKFRSVLNDPIFNFEIIRDKDKFRNQVLEQVKHLAGHGYGAMAFTEEYGGIDNMPVYSSIFENLMYAGGSLTIKFGVQFGLFGGSIQNLGTKKHHDKYLKETGEAKLLGCFAMTETRHGSNVRGVRTTATYVKETDSIIIDTPGENDNKEYIGNALHSTMATVFAQLIVDGKNEGVHAVLVKIRDENGNLLEGVRVEDNGYKLGLNGVDNGKIWFTNVEVPRENLLNKYGDIDENGVYSSPIENPNKRFFTMLGTLVGGRICVAKGALSGAKKALTIAVKYALQRRQFNSDEKIQEDLIMDYPTHQVRLIKPIAYSYIYHTVLDKLIEEYAVSEEEERRQIETKVAALKATITWFSNNTIQECREACGGKGYLLENEIPYIKGDVDIFTTFEGDNTVLIQLAAKGILTDFKTEFNSDNFMDVLKYVGTNVSDRLTTINPIFTNKTDKEHLFDPEFHKNALEYRTRRLTFSAASRLQKYIKKGMPSYQAFLKVQTHLVALGKAYSKELSYNAFNDFVENISDEKTQFLFKKLGVLYALSEIEEDASWYLQQGYISTNKFKAIRKRVERLCTELRPHVNVLVDGYGIPKNCIIAPIAK
ncbi:acyl-CoA dehydrogenase family protein [Galbibacter mesophilus]|uniref:acyl-CoA dehydrogenase family protein n=1 Tax=Galbibacter mesophilus TaxID=379069 RepID=UPI00191E2D0E|nr:acyl-CoA dehydrogenase [Galbibacter mesophilus]MCM5661884.1 acyl-CoA dehydrogenase family protein [Galbibacter mesophilus]